MDCPTRWNIEMSHMVSVPRYIDATTLVDLRSRVQHIADAKKERSDRPAIGEIFFRYELDDQDRAKVVHCYFEDRHQKRRRFMRLRRD